MTDWMRYAERVVAERYGARVSCMAAGDMTRRHGRVTTSIINTETLVAQLQSPEVEETYATTNSIDSVVSSSAADTGTVRAQVQGYYYDGTDLVYHTQLRPLVGQTPVTLTQPLCRVDRAYNPIGIAYQGVISVFDSTLAGGTTAGVPNNAAATKLTIQGPSFQESSKCAFSVAANEYAFVAQLQCSIERQAPPTNTVDIRVQRRDQNGVWRTTCMLTSLTTDAVAQASMEIHPWVPFVPNADGRVICLSTAINIPVNATLGLVRARILDV